MIHRRFFKGFIKGRRGERGATAVEFALVAPVFLMFALGIADLGRLFWVKNLMQYGVDRAVRYVVVNPTISATALEDYANTQVDGLFTGIIFTADAPGTTVDTVNNADGSLLYEVSYREIRADYAFSYMMPLVSLNDIPYSAYARTPVNQ